MQDCLRKRPEKANKPVSSYVALVVSHKFQQSKCSRDPPPPRNLSINPPMHNIRVATACQHLKSAILVGQAAKITKSGADKLELTPALRQVTNKLICVRLCQTLEPNHTNILHPNKCPTIQAKALDSLDRCLLLMLVTGSNCQDGVERMLSLSYLYNSFIPVRTLLPTHALFLDLQQGLGLEPHLWHAEAQSN